MIPHVWNVKTPATTWAVDLATATAQCKQTTGVDVDLITQAYKAAQKIVQDKSGRVLTQETRQMSLSRFWGRLWLPGAPASLTFIKYYDTSNVLQTLSSSVYTLPAFHEPALIKLADGQVWPSTYQRDDAVQLEWVSGYADAATAAAQHPQLVRAILMLIGHFDANREAILTGTISKQIEMATDDMCALDLCVWRPPTDSTEDY